MEGILMWCHSCKAEFQAANSASFECIRCHNDFCEKITSAEEDPRTFVPFGEEQNQTESQQQSQFQQHQQQQQPQQQYAQQQQNPLNGFFNAQNHIQQLQSTLGSLLSRNRQRSQGNNQMDFQQLPAEGLQSFQLNSQNLNSVGQSHPQLDQPQNNQGNGNRNPMSVSISIQAAQINDVGPFSGINSLLSSFFPATAQRNRGSGLFGMGEGNNSFENILDFIMRNDTNIYGTPPAAESSVQNLPKIKFVKDTTSEQSSHECTVCREEFEDDGEELLKMPCNHLFHQECLHTWLKMHNSCPTCRHELPTDNQDYERRKQQRLLQRQQQQQQERNQ